jgi:hypothetical protein
MSSYSLFPAAPGSPIAVVAQKWSAHIVDRLSTLPKLAQVTPASQLEVRPAPEMVSSGVGEIDALTGGFPRGGLTEVCGTASSGRTSVLLATLAAATQRQEVCALVDVSDAFDPVSAAHAGVDFERLLWVRCRASQEYFSPRRHRATEKNNVQRVETPVEQALRVTDLLLQSGGFGLAVIDLGDVPVRIARRIPLTSWFRFQRAVERTPTVLFVVTQTPCAQTCAALLLKMQASRKRLSASGCQLSPAAPGIPAHTQLLDGLHVEGELLRSRWERKPVRSVTAAFATRAVRIS